LHACTWLQHFEGVIALFHIEYYIKKIAIGIPPNILYGNSLKLRACSLPYGNLHIILVGWYNQFWRSFLPPWICHNRQKLPLCRELLHFKYVLYYVSLIPRFHIAFFKVSFPKDGTHVFVSNTTLFNTCVGSWCIKSSKYIYRWVCHHYAFIIVICKLFTF
jgi:hypothetical protein